MIYDDREVRGDQGPIHHLGDSAPQHALDSGKHAPDYEQTSLATATAENFERTDLYHPTRHYARNDGAPSHDHDKKHPAHHDHHCAPAPGAEGTEILSGDGYRDEHFAREHHHHGNGAGVYLGNGAGVYLAVSAVENSIFIRQP